MTIDLNDTIYISETGNHAIRLWNSNSFVLLTTDFPPNSPQGIAIFNGFFYGSDTTNNVIRKFYNGSFIDSLGVALNGPHQLAIDCASNLYVADTYNNAIKVITSNGSTFNVGWGYKYPTGLKRIYYRSCS